MTKRFDSAEEMERVFDAGEESILDYADMSTATVSKPVARRISMDMAPGMVVRLDAEAERLGVNRQAVIKFACDRYLAEVEDRQTALRPLGPMASSMGRADSSGGCNTR